MSAYRVHRVAAALPGAVRSGDDAGFAVLMGRVSGERELRELVRVLAASADPERLARITRYEVPARLLEAHAAYERLRKANKPRPAHLKAGERAYQRHVKRAQRSTARERAA